MMADVLAILVYAGGFVHTMALGRTRCNYGWWQSGFAGLLWPVALGMALVEWTYNQEPLD